MFSSKRISKIKGERQRQNKLVSSERSFKILQNETKIVKIRRAVLEIFKFKHQDLESFPRKNDRKPKMSVLRGFVQTENNRLFDVRTAKCTIKQ